LTCSFPATVPSMWPSSSSSVWPRSIGSGRSWNPRSCCSWAWAATASTSSRPTYGDFGGFRCGRTQQRSAALTCAAAPQQLHHRPRAIGRNEMGGVTGARPPSTRAEHLVLDEPTEGEENRGETGGRGWTEEKYWEGGGFLQNATQLGADCWVPQVTHRQIHGVPSTSNRR
jgi:hypothetical protein